MVEQMSFYSYGTKSLAGTTLASKISNALSRVIQADGQGDENDDDLQDLIQLLDELNSHTELTVKLSNQSKICKILQ
jgi:hypothetical protein